MGLGDFVDSVTEAVSDAVSDIGRFGRETGSFVDDYVKNPALALFANPLIAQDLMGAAFTGALTHGADTRTALAYGSSMAANPGVGFDSQQWGDLMAFNAALLAGAGTAGLASVGIGGAGGLVTTPMAGLVPTVGSSAGLGIAAGAAVGAGAYAGSQALNSGLGDSGDDYPSELPPDLASMYANDPDMALQFQRMRKSARMLGRAGTFRGTKGSLGGDISSDALGGQLALVGT